MASFMSNWWTKHDMDRDGKGCFFIFLVILGVAVLIGAVVAGALVFVATKAVAC